MAHEPTNAWSIFTPFWKAEMRAPLFGTASGYITYGSSFDRSTVRTSAYFASGSGLTGVSSLSVQSTTLDDVFVHYTGRQLRDALQEPSPLDRGFMMRRS